MVVDQLCQRNARFWAPSPFWAWRIGWADRRRSESTPVGQERPMSRCRLISLVAGGETLEITIRVWYHRVYCIQCERACLRRCSVVSSPRVTRLLKKKKVDLHDPNLPVPKALHSMHSHPPQRRSVHAIRFLSAGSPLPVVPTPSSACVGHPAPCLPATVDSSRSR